MTSIRRWLLVLTLSFFRIINGISVIDVEKEKGTLIQ
jgi:hypothetical protein